MVMMMLQNAKNKPPIFLRAIQNTFPLRTGGGREGGSEELQS